MEKKKSTLLLLLEHAHSMFVSNKDRFAGVMIDVSPLIRAAKDYAKVSGMEDVWMYLERCSILIGVGYGDAALEELELALGVVRK